MSDAFDGRASHVTKQSSDVTESACTEYSITMKKALDLALNYLILHEPGDSRAVSDQFVAMYSVSCGDASPEVMSIIDRALAEQTREAHTSIDLPPFPFTKSGDA